MQLLSAKLDYAPGVRNPIPGASHSPYLIREDLGGSRLARPVASLYVFSQERRAGIRRLNQSC